MNQNNESLPSDRESGPTVSRRHLLKLLGASGAVVGLNRLLPLNWVTPEVVAAEPDVEIDFCSEGQLDLSIVKSRADLVSNHTDLWNVSFSYIDNAGILSESAYLTASVIPDINETAQTIYNMTPLGGVGGLGIMNRSGYDSCNITLPNSGEITLTNQSFGRGFFLLTYPEPKLALDSRTAVAAAPTVEWFLEEPAARQSGTAQTLLSDPTAVTLEDLTVNDGKASLAAAAGVAGAAALGAATVKALQNDK